MFALVSQILISSVLIQNICESFYCFISFL